MPGIAVLVAPSHAAVDALVRIAESGELWVRTAAIVACVAKCRRVIVVSADEATSDQLLEWIGTGFLSSGAASTEADVTKAALPFFFAIMLELCILVFFPGIVTWIPTLVMG